MGTVHYVLMAPVAVIVASQAVAQTPEENDKTVVTKALASNAPTLGDKVITAQRLEQRSQNFGISITVFSGEQLTGFSVSSPQDQVAATSGLRNPQSGSGLTTIFSLHGLSQNDFGASQETDRYYRLITFDPADSFGSSESQFRFPRTMASLFATNLANDSAS